MPYLLSRSLCLITSLYFYFLADLFPHLFNLCPEKRIPRAHTRVQQFTTKNVILYGCAHTEWKRFAKKEIKAKITIVFWGGGRGGEQKTHQKIISATNNRAAHLGSFGKFLSHFQVDKRSM